MSFFLLLPSRTNHQAWDIISAWSVTQYLSSPGQLSRTLHSGGNQQKKSAVVRNQSGTRCRRWEMERACCLVWESYHRWGSNGPNIWSYKAGSRGVCRPFHKVYVGWGHTEGIWRAGRSTQEASLWKRYLLLMFVFSFCSGLGITVLVCFCKMSGKCSDFKNPRIWSHSYTSSHLLRKCKWTQKRQCLLIYRSCSGCF